MDTHTATEQAYINGYEKGKEETAEKIYKDLKLLVSDNAVDIITRYFKEIMDIEIK